MVDPDLTQIRSDIAEILACLKGNGLGESEGIISKVRTNQASITVLAKTIDRARWTLAGLSLGAGLAGGGLAAVVGHLAG